MIQNRGTASHDIYLPDERAPKQAPAKAPEHGRVVEGDPDGTLEEKCAWMRARQKARRDRR